MIIRPRVALSGAVIAVTLTGALAIGTASAQTTTTGAAAAAATTTVAAAAPAATTTTLPHWTYEGEEGPTHWGELSPAYAACADGSAQTPIDIRKSVPAKLDKIVFSYTGNAVTETNNGHTIVANAAEGNSITVGAMTYPLAQVHFHAPSEHKLNGRLYPAEFHFVHKTADGKLAVIGVFIERGKKANPAYDAFLAGSTVAKDAKQPETFDWMSMLPKDKTTYRYQGSLTTPPCSEGVSWFVMKNAVQMSAAQLKTLTAAFMGNNRPVQKLNGRVVNIVTQK